MSALPKNTITHVRAAKKIQSHMFGRLKSTYTMFFRCESTFLGNSWSGVWFRSGIGVALVVLRCGKRFLCWIKKLKNRRKIPSQFIEKHIHGSSRGHKTVLQFACIRIFNGWVFCCATHTLFPDSACLAMQFSELPHDKKLLQHAIPSHFPSQHLVWSGLPKKKYCQVVPVSRVQDAHTTLSDFKMFAKTCNHEGTVFRKKQQCKLIFKRIL